MARDIEVVKYTEYTKQISTGTVITQVPDEPELPVQIIYKSDKQTIFKLDELEEINEAARESLAMAGWVETKASESDHRENESKTPSITSRSIPH